MSSALPQAVVLLMSNRRARVHHYLWHEVRNMWLSYDDATRDVLQAKGWEPPRPARKAATAAGPGGAILDNGSGEDFLFMHRKMIASVDEVLLEVGDPAFPRVVGWRPLPRPGDLEDPVPPAWDTGDEVLNRSLEKWKSTEFFENVMVRWERDYADPEKLRGWTLGELGSRIEFTIHNMMHMRWASEARARPDVDPTSPETIPEKWDDPSYDWLGDTYASHVNGVFWKVHGWVDDRIGDWMSANGHTGPVPWSFDPPWVGDMPHGLEDQDPHRAMGWPADAGGQHLPPDHHDRMDQAVAAVLKAGRFHHFYDPVEVPADGP